MNGIHWHRYLRVRESCYPQKSVDGNLKFVEYDVQVEVVQLEKLMGLVGEQSIKTEFKKT